MLKQQIARLETDVRTKDGHCKKLFTLIKERDSRKKNAEKLLDQMEKRNKELIEDNVKKEHEIEDLRKRTTEFLTDLQRCKEDLAQQDDLRKKREEQVQALLAQIKRREQENLHMTRELRKREEENKALNAQIQGVTAKVEKDVKMQVQKQLEEMRGLAAAKEGEMRVVKEMIKSYHHQLKQKEVEVVRFKKKAEIKRTAVRLPPLEQPDLPSSKASSQLRIRPMDKSKGTSPIQSELDDEKALDELISQSQAGLVPTKTSPHKRQYSAAGNSQDSVEERKGKKEEIRPEVEAVDGIQDFEGEPPDIEELPLDPDLDGKDHLYDSEFAAENLKEEFSKATFADNQYGELEQYETAENPEGEQIPAHSPHSSLSPNPLVSNEPKTDFFPSGESPNPDLQSDPLVLEDQDSDFPADPLVPENPSSDLQDRETEFAVPVRPEDTGKPHSPALDLPRSDLLNADSIIDSPEKSDFAVSEIPPNAQEDAEPGSPEF